MRVFCFSWIVQLVVGMFGLLTVHGQTIQVTPDELVHASDNPENWVMHSGQYHSQRFSSLTQIDRENVDQLQLAWVRQLPTLGQVQTTPLVVDGVMYFDNT